MNETFFDEAITCHRCKKNINVLKKSEKNEIIIKCSKCGLRMKLTKTPILFGLGSKTKIRALK